MKSSFSLSPAGGGNSASYAPEGRVAADLVGLAVGGARDVDLFGLRTVNTSGISLTAGAAA